MRNVSKARIVSAAIVLAAVAINAPAARAADCAAPQTALSVSRIVEIDASTGPLFGSITKQPRQADFLQPREVVLTFDDGPMPWITKSILDTLDKFCTKATFFSVGRMAVAYPETLRSILDRGHTLGTHTWSHPMNIRAMRSEATINEIERGFAAVAASAGQPIAPFFRYPGLSDTGSTLAHLQKRGVATFTVDVVSNDSYIPTTERLVRETLAKVESRNGGILLFHDIKAVTARALPEILTELKRLGYKVVHITSRHAFVPDQRLAGEYGAQIARMKGLGQKATPFYGAVGPQTLAAATGAPIVTLQPPAASYGEQGREAKQSGKARSHARAQVASNDTGMGWVTTVRRSQKLRAQRVE